MATAVDPVAVVMADSPVEGDTAAVSLLAEDMEDLVEEAEDMEDLVGEAEVLVTAAVLETEVDLEAAAEVAKDQLSSPKKLQCQSLTQFLYQSKEKSKFLFLSEFQCQLIDHTPFTFLNPSQSQ